MQKYLLILAALVSFTAAALGQTSMGRILGTVTDTTGAIVRGAEVTITNTATGVVREVTTTSAGDYVAPDLEPGPYSVAVEASGFGKVVRVGLVLEVARDIRVDAQLKPGPVSQTVTIDSQAPVINTTSPRRGLSVSSIN